MQEIIEDVSDAVARKLLHSTSSSLSCTICQEVMFTPFILNCGHSFCYHCLKEWFKNRQECPLCRTKVKRPPSLNITLREIVNGFVAIIKSDPLSGAKAASLKEYEEDLNDHNLFLRTFNNLIETTLDRSDGVPRCSRCLWEAHGSSCRNCGATFIDDHDSEEGEDLYFSDFEFEERDDQEDEEGSDGSSFLDDRDLSAINDDLEDPYADLLSDNGGEDDEHEGSSSVSDNERLISEQNWEGFGDDQAHSDDNEFEEAIRRVNEDHSLTDDDSDNDFHMDIGRSSRRSRILDSDDSDEGL